MPKWTEYTTKDTLADNDEVMLYDATARANKRGLMSKFWDYVVDKMSTAIISKLETKNKTIIGALNYLNGKKESNSENIDSASDLAEDVLEKCHNGEIRLFTIQSTVSIEKGSPDGQGGFLLAYQSKAGSAYGIVVLFSYSEKIWMKVKDITWNNWKKIQLS
nr:MAG TPA: hypothetical protein [Caudoviricetes sp.]